MSALPDPPQDTYKPGSREDFDRLYKNAYPRVYRTLTAILGDPAEAEDCTQDAFVKAFQAWKRWRPDENVDDGEQPAPAAVTVKVTHKNVVQTTNVAEHETD